MNLWIIKGNGLFGKLGEKEDFQVTHDGLFDGLDILFFSCDSVSSISVLLILFY